MFVLGNVWWREKEKMGNRSKEQTSRNERTRSRSGDKKGTKGVNKVNSTTRVSQSD